MLPTLRKTSYVKKDVIADIAAGIKPHEIADKHGITINIVYTIKTQAVRAGLITSRGYKTMEDRLKDELKVFDPGMRERIKDMREMDLTTTEITDLLQKEGMRVKREDVEAVMARGANLSIIPLSHRAGRGKPRG